MAVEPCAMCGGKSDAKASVQIIVSGPGGSTGRRWGGGRKEGFTALCLDCAFVLDEAAKDAISATLRAAERPEEGTQP